ncbi:MULTISPECIES: transcriptional regulator ArgR [Thalassotalea]|uniref:transcriptional regulator ArgR n=1 Tax=Thalassotalea TaxID=1518149 RepID=UPI000945B449|nr:MULTISPECIES: transcriptional regulator ArgR [Thalassotalea]MDO6427161.1 transcriptional regulator ArgR [Thalassotalea sp. 1_MG-2023]OKY26459.1 ArgR family transcriptional regulator [Thalassotalea sp. PP2-459]
MTSIRKKNEAELIIAFKSLLKEQCYGSQGQLAAALAEQGFKNMSQAKISRLLSKLGAVKMRNASDQVVYILPDELAIPKSRQAIQSVVASVKHNNMQIIVKTGIGGAPLISRMLDSMGESAGILGTLAGDDTIFIAPIDVKRIDQTTEDIKRLLDV